MPAAAAGLPAEVKGTGTWEIVGAKLNIRLSTSAFEWYEDTTAIAPSCVGRQQEWGTLWDRANGHLSVCRLQKWDILGLEIRDTLDLPNPAPDGAITAPFCSFPRQTLLPPVELRQPFKCPPGYVFSVTIYDLLRFQDARGVKWFGQDVDLSIP